MQINKYANQNKIKDIHERIYAFIIRVINLTKQLPKNVQNERIIPQIIDAVTSMGANDQEADASESRKDFIAKYRIVKKENKETNYWLRIIADTNPTFIKRMSDLRQEGNEILRIVSSIIISARRSQK